MKAIVGICILAGVAILAGAGSASASRASDLTGTTLGAPAPSKITLVVSPSFAACRDLDPAVPVTVSWGLPRGVTSFTLNGFKRSPKGVQVPITIKVRREAMLRGSRRLYVPCSGTMQTLTLTAIGSGGSSTATFGFGETRV
jgi:hypothetical protein